MWYKFALTEIEPTGQTNFPDMGHGKLDFNDLKFVNIDRGKYHVNRYGKLDTYRISVIAPGSIEQIGFIDYGYFAPTNTVVIFLIKIFDIKKTITDQDHIMTNTGRGIATKLYEKVLEDIRTNPKLAGAEYVYSNVHSLQSYNAKNKVFGEPEYLGKNMDFGQAFKQLILSRKSLDELLEYDKIRPGIYQDRIDDEKKEIEALEKIFNKLKINPAKTSKMVAPSSDGEWGTNFGGKSFDAIHRIPEKLEETKIQEKDPNQLELFSQDDL